MRRALAVLGLLGLLPIGLGLLEGRLTLTEAGSRAAVLALVLLCAGKIVLPFVSRLIGPARNGEFLVDTNSSRRPNKKAGKAAAAAPKDKKKDKSSKKK